MRCLSKENIKLIYNEVIRRSGESCAILILSNGLNERSMLRKGFFVQHAFFMV